MSQFQNNVIEMFLIRPFTKTAKIVRSAEQVTTELKIEKKIKWHLRLGNGRLSK